MEIGLILTALLSGGFIGAVLGFIGAGGAMVIFDDNEEVHFGRNCRSDKHSVE